MSLYAPGSSWVHRLDPVSKLLLSGVLLALTFILADLRLNAALLALALAVLISGGALRRAWPVFAGVSVLALSFFVIQGLVHPANERVAFALGPVAFYVEGLTVGLRLALRLFNILSATLIVVLLTAPQELVESLSRRGLPSRFAYVILAVLQILPLMAERTGSILDAQRSRGLETEGSLVARARAFIPLLAPLVVSSLADTEMRALALEVRGFGSGAKASYLHEEHIPRYAAVVRVAALLLLCAGIAQRWVMPWLL